MGCRAAATSSALATSSSGDTRTSANSGSALSRAVAAIVSVMSICRNSVTCGAVKALAVTAAAVCLRTPRIAIRSSRATAVDRGQPAPEPGRRAGGPAGRRRPT